VRRGRRTVKATARRARPVRSDLRLL